ncbi:MAG TPA: insulinase family protein, partial [Rhodospirillales bacterium]|nr:insulinase family protein [Rhodospirillales bacterium]
WYRVGSADEEPGKTGAAHLLEHLMFKGTPAYPSGAFSKIVARNGGQENAFTSQDYTGYYQTIAVDRLEKVMAMEADRMTNLILSENDVKTERLVVLEERRQRIDNNPSAILREYVNAAMFLNYPYRNPVIGWADEIRSLTRKDILAFYRRWYGPDNAIVVIAGDVTVEQVRPMAERTYGKIPAVSKPPRPRPGRVRPQEPPQKASRRVVLKDERVRQPFWSRQFMAPSYRNGATGQAYALEVLSEIFGDGSTSRLYRSLVVERKLAVSAGVRYDPSALGPARFVVYASPRLGVSIEQLKNAVADEIKILLKSGVTSDELERTVRRMQADAVYARDSLSTGAQVLGESLVIGMSIDDVESWPERIGAVTVEQINAAARAVLIRGHSVTSTLLPLKEGS